MRETLYAWPATLPEGEWNYTGGRMTRGLTGRFVQQETGGIVFASDWTDTVHSAAEFNTGERFEPIGEVLAPETPTPEFRGEPLLDELERVINLPGPADPDALRVLIRPELAAHRSGGTEPVFVFCMWLKGYMDMHGPKFFAGHVQGKISDTRADLARSKSTMGVLEPLDRQVIWPGYTNQIEKLQQQNAALHARIVELEARLTTTNPFPGVQGQASAISPDATSRDLPSDVLNWVTAWNRGGQ